MAGATSVLIVDDHARFRSLARKMLEAAGFVVAGEAADGAAAIAAAARLHPDFILLDIQLPDIDGFEVASRLARSSHGARVVLVSSREPSDYGDRVALSEAAGFIAKERLSQRTLRSVLAAP